MKLARIGEMGKETPALVGPDGVLRDLSNHIGDIEGTSLAPEPLDCLRTLDPAELPPVPPDTRVGACVGKVGKIVCIGLNYEDHAAEVGKGKPPEPVVFMKATTAISGPFDPIEIPRGSQQTDWEIELGVVIGSRAKYVETAEARRHIAGFCTINDISERAFQSERQGQWTKGKSHDSHAPLGPWLVTADEVPDPQNLRLWCEVDGVLRQDSSTHLMMFGVDEIVAYLSQFMTLEPGDIIATGTPAGVGKGIKPEPLYLTAGGRLRCGVEGLGEQDHSIVAA